MPGKHVYDVAQHRAEHACVELDHRAGRDLDMVYDAVRTGAGGSRMFDIRAPLMIERDYSSATMKIDVYQKDIDIIGAYASGLHCPTPLFEASKAFYTSAYALGHAKDDTASICAVLEGMAGTAASPNAAKKKRTAQLKSPSTLT